MLDALVRGQLETEAGKANQSRALDIQQQGIDNAKEQQDKAARAATVKGAFDVASTMGQGYLTYKAVTRPSEMSELLAYQKGLGAAGTTAPVTDSAITSASGSFSAPSAEAAGYTLHTTPAYTSPTIGAQTSLAGGTTAAGAQVAPAATGSAAYTGATGTAAYGSAEGAGAASTLAAEEGTAAGGTSAAGSSAAGPAIAAAYVGTYGPSYLKRAGMNDVWSKGIIRGPESFLGSAAKHVAGDTVGRIIDPVGALGDKIAESVICSELLRQGRITERDRTRCVVFRFRHIPDDMFHAYIEWAEPHVTAMRKGGWRNMIRLPFAHAFVGFMVAMQTGKKPTFMQRMVWKYAWNRCEKIAQRNEQFVGEVA